MRSSLLFLAAALPLLASPAARADDAARYTIEKTASGYVRMDKLSGDVSTCTDNNGQFVCRMAADDRKAFQDDLDRLEGRVDRLERRIDALEKANTGIARSLLPSDQDVDKSLAVMERFFRRFMGMVKDLDKEQNMPDKGTPEKGPQDKT